MYQKAETTSRILCTVFIALFLFSCSNTEAPQSQGRPNVMVILTDDMGFSDIGCFGSEINTPNIDRLAEDGLKFTQFYNTPRCSPTRASLMTGLYPHQAGMGRLATSVQFQEPGYFHDLSKNTVTLAELFKANGYNTYMTGKWHLTHHFKPNDGDKSNWPLQRGFEKYFGITGGSASFYNPKSLVSGNEPIAPGENFYLTDAISDTTVKYINQHQGDKPFFFYVAYTTAHWPMHAPEQEVEKYKGFYDKGWDEIRKERFEKLKKLGIIDKRAVLTERSVDIPEWKDEPLKAWQARRMEVYAAMIDIMDQGVGRIITALEEKGMLENTIIFYMHDNGACAEFQGEQRDEVPLTEEQKILRPFPKDSILIEGVNATHTRDGHFVRRGRGIMPGGDDTWVAVGEAWANVSNTPFRLYKHWVHEGGISTPMIVHWPAGIKAKNEMRNQTSQLIDIMATCIDIADLEYPKVYNGNQIQPYEGKSLVPAFGNNPVERDFLFWEHEGNRAIRIGKWKLVSKVEKLSNFTADDENSWELYDMESDRSETNNLAEKYPEKVKEMAELWEKEAWRTKAKPWPWQE